LLIPLIVVAVCAAISARLWPEGDPVFAWALGCFIVYLISTREGGLDYEEYVYIIETVRSLHNEDVLLRIVAAKDPLFWVLIEMCGALSESPDLVMATVGALSIAGKIYATREFPEYRTLFMAIYAVFLAPGLEFAAIRAGLALSLLLIGLVLVGRARVLWFLLAIAAHVSTGIAVLGQLLRSRVRAVAAVLFLGALTLTPYFSIHLSQDVFEFARDDDRLGTYFDNQGTVRALIAPVITLAILFLIDRSRRLTVQPDHRSEVDLAPAAMCTLVALLAALPAVTVSFRILEIGWALMLFNLVAITARRAEGAGELVPASAWFCLLLLIGASNVIRSTWSVMFGPA